MLEHEFADSVEAMRSKVERYALCGPSLREDPRPLKPPLLQHCAHLLREMLLKGSLFRGGLKAVGLADAVAYHHARKYTLLREVRSGGHAELVEAFEQGRLEDLFRLVSGYAHRPLPSIGPAALDVPTLSRPRGLAGVAASLRPPE